MLKIKIGCVFPFPPNTKRTTFLDLSCKSSFRENALYDFTNGAELKT